MGATATVEKNEYRNVSGAIIGAVIEDADGKPKGIPVEPNETVWLNERERIRTANAPRREEDNPFSNGSFVKVTEGGDVKNKRPIDAPMADAAPAASAAEEPPSGGGLATEERPPDPEEEESSASAPGEETGASPLPAAPPVEGKPAPHEEVGQPDAAGRAAEARATDSAIEQQAARGQVQQTRAGAPPEGRVSVAQGGTGPEYREAPDQPEEK